MGVLAIALPNPEPYVPLKKVLDTQEGDRWGYLTVTMETTEAFVIGEQISVNIELAIFLEIKTDLYVTISFPDSMMREKLGHPFQIITFISERIDNQSQKTEDGFLIMKPNCTLIYPRDGIFGINISMTNYIADVNRTYFSIYEEDSFYFSNVIHIKPYSYLEARTLNKRILGLAIFTIIPIAITIIGLLERLARANLWKKIKGRIIKAVFFFGFGFGD